MLGYSRRGIFPIHLKLIFLFLKKWSFQFSKFAGDFELVINSIQIQHLIQQSSTSLYNDVNSKIIKICLNFGFFLLQKTLFGKIENYYVFYKKVFTSLFHLQRQSGVVTRCFLALNICYRNWIRKEVRERNSFRSSERCYFPIALQFLMVFSTQGYNI